MTKPLFIFLGTFALGALVALAARTAWFDPNAAAASPDASATAATVHPAPAHPAAHGDRPVAAAASPKKTVNTVCAICGMDVDPSLATAEYKGQTIGFGCRMCPPKFKANPDKYGPAYLRNEVLEN